MIFFDCIRLNNSSYLLAGLLDQFVQLQVSLIRSPSSTFLCFVDTNIASGNDFFSSFVAQCVKLVSEILITKVCEEGNGVFDPEYWTRQVTTINRQKEAKATWDVYDMEEGKKMAFISIKPRVTNH